MMRDNDLELPLALTMGEPSGIGPEITLKAWIGRGSSSLPPFFVVGDASLYRETALSLGIDVPVREIEAPEETATVFPAALPVLPLPAPLEEKPVPGRLSADRKSTR